MSAEDPGKSDKPGNADSCVLCGKCLEVCPLLAATGREELAPRSKARLAALMGAALVDAGPEGLNGRGEAALDDQAMAALASLCLGCGRCREACSQGVDIPGMVSRLRAEYPGWKTWLWKQWMRRARALWPLAGKAASKIPAALSSAGPERLSGLLKLAQGLGREPVEPFISISGLAESSVTEALLFPGCAASFTAPHWTRAAQALCSGLGIGLIEARFACCGSGLGLAGLRRERLEAAERNVNIWRAGNRPKLIVFCASCLAGLAAYADDRTIFADRAEAGQWTESLTPLAGLLDAGVRHDGLLNSDRIVVSPVSPKGASQTIAYHRPCHLLGHVDGRLEGRDPDQALLHTLLGEGAFDVSRQCCGFGGVLQLGAPKLSRQVADRCWQALLPASVPQENTLVLTGCTACVFQLEATAPPGVRAAHWLESIETT